LYTAALGTILLTAALSAPGRVAAQMPSAPVLQNAWASPGIAVAADLGGGGDGTVYGLAAGWTPSSGRFQLSGGVGWQARTGAGSRAAYGARVAVPVLGRSAAFGAAAFAGFGGASGSGSTARTVGADTTGAITQIPVGVSLGWRHALNGARGFSFYASPYYMWLGGSGQSAGLFRVAAGLDAGITPRIGITVGIDLGANRVRPEGGPSGILYGLGATYALSK
jgi:hypothetical protein